MNYMTLRFAVIEFCSYGEEGSKIQQRILYQKLQKFVQDKCSQVLAVGRESDGVSLLKYYNAKYTDFKFAAKVVSNLCAYMNQHWVERCKERAKERKCLGIEVPEVDAQMLAGTAQLRGQVIQAARLGDGGLEAARV